MTSIESAVNVCSTHVEAENAVRQMQKAGFDMKKLSIVGKNYHGEGNVGGLSAPGAGLYGLGIPQNSIMAYETALKQDKFLVIAHGTTEEVAKAKNILGTTKAL